MVRRLLMYIALAVLVAGCVATQKQPTEVDWGPEDWEAEFPDEIPKSSLSQPLKELTASTYIIYEEPTEFVYIELRATEMAICSHQEVDGVTVTKDILSLTDDGCVRVGDHRIPLSRIVELLENTCLGSSVSRDQ